MTTFLWILLSGIAMSALAWIGGLTFFFREEALKRILHPLVALAAGTLLGGAIFHLLPEGLRQIENPQTVFLSFAAGFTTLLFVEQFLYWQHAREHTAAQKKPLGYLILLADGLHNLIGGLGIGAAIITDLRLGLTAWVAAALHELPQEMGDFGILVQSGWGRKKALIVNFLSALTFPIGAVAVYFFSGRIDVSFLIPFAAGNFVYIAASGLIPEIKHHAKSWYGLLNFAVFTAGLAFLCLVGRIV